MAGKLSEAARTRLRSLRRDLRAQALDALVVTNLSNLRYLCGFTGTMGSLVIGLRSQRLLVDTRYATQAAKQAPGFKIVDTTHRAVDLADQFCALKAERVAYEADHLTHARFLELKRAAKGVKLVRVNDVLSRMRARKDPAEARLIKRAANIALDAFNAVLPLAKPGMSENQFALALETRMRELGSSKAAFDTIVASGPRGALPHGVASDKKMKKGELVTVDFGAIYRGYQSDQTITFCLGRARKKQRLIYDTVRRAHDLALAAIAPGVACQQVDKIARDVIEAAGYGEYFGHGLGHGVGLDTHEAPNLNRLNKSLLEVGHVVTVEPGIYLPGWGGVRIEDMALVTATGSRLLTASGGDLREL